MAPLIATTKKRDFDPTKFLTTIGEKLCGLQRNNQFTLKAQPVKRCFISTEGTAEKNTGKVEKKVGQIEKVFEK